MDQLSDETLNLTISTNILASTGGVHLEELMNVQGCKMWDPCGQGYPQSMVANNQLSTLFVGQDESEFHFGVRLSMHDANMHSLSSQLHVVTVHLAHTTSFDASDVYLCMSDATTASIDNTPPWEMDMTRTRYEEVDVGMHRKSWLDFEILKASNGNSEKTCFDGQNMLNLNTACKQDTPCDFRNNLFKDTVVDVFSPLVDSCSTYETCKLPTPILDNVVFAGVNVMNTTREQSISFVLPNPLHPSATSYQTNSFVLWFKANTYNIRKTNWDTAKLETGMDHRHTTQNNWMQLVGTLVTQSSNYKVLPLDTMASTITSVQTNLTIDLSSSALERVAAYDNPFGQN